MLENFKSQAGIRRVTTHLMYMSYVTFVFFILSIIFYYIDYLFFDGGMTTGFISIYTSCAILFSGILVICFIGLNLERFVVVANRAFQNPIAIIERSMDVVLSREGFMRKNVPGSNGKHSSGDQYFSNGDAYFYDQRVKEWVTLRSNTFTKGTLNETIDIIPNLVNEDVAYQFRGHNMDIGELQTYIEKIAIEIKESEILLYERLKRENDDNNKNKNTI